VIELATRRIEISGITPNPDEAWMMQIGRNTTDLLDGSLADKRLLILDRDTKFSLAFRALLKGAGVEVVRLPYRSPNLNAYASHCTSSVRFGRTLGWWRLSESLVPCCLTGELGPGCG